MPLTTKTTAKKRREAFLATLSTTGNATQAAEVAKLDRSALYRLRKNDEAFAEAWAEAEELGVEALEDEACRRAFDGSDTLLIFLLKGKKPDKYRERTEVTGKGGGPVTFVMEIGGS